MSGLVESYKSLLEQCHASRDRYREVDLIVSSIGVGKQYSNKLFVVGRASNGGKDGFSKNEPQDYPDILAGLAPEIGKSNLDWVAQRWGAKEGYNTNKSAFWRVARNLAEHMARGSDDCIDYICCSNLYKVAPDGGNPSGRLMGIQYPQCVDILRLEIELTTPENIIFLTGHGWAKSFLESLGVYNQLNSPDYNFVEFASYTKGIKYVVGQHPQGKPEEPHCEEIIQAFKHLNMAN